MGHSRCVRHRRVPGVRPGSCPLRPPTRHTDNRAVGVAVDAVAATLTTRAPRSHCNGLWGLTTSATRLAASACERSAYRTLRRRPSKENPHPQSQVRLGASSRESTHRLASRVAEACSHRVNLITGDTLNFGLTAAPASSTGARTDPERLRGPTKEPRNHYDCKSPLHQGRR